MKHIPSRTEIGCELFVSHHVTTQQSPTEQLGESVIAAAVEALKPFRPTPPDTRGMSIRDSLDAMVDYYIVEEWEALEDAANAIQALAKDKNEAPLAKSLMRRLAHRAAHLFLREVTLTEKITDGAKLVSERERTTILQMLSIHQSRLTLARSTLERVFIVKFRRGLRAHIEATKKQCT